MGPASNLPTPLVVLSRSCPPDVGGYQRQFSMILPRLGAERRVVAVSAVREPADRRSGWPGVSNIIVPAHRLPRRLRGLTDPLLVALATLVGIALRMRWRRGCSLLVLSPGVPGWAQLVWFWRRAIGRVLVRFATGGDARRLGMLGGLDVLAVAPGPEQVGELEQVGLHAGHVRNAVGSGEPSTLSSCVAVVGRLIARKRVDLILDAWEAASPDLPGWRLLLVGSGQSERDSVETSLRRRAAAIGDSVVCAGEMPDPWAVAGDASLLVIASEREGSPNSVLEALARGIPVAAPEGEMARWFDPVPPHLAFTDVTHLAQLLRQLAGGDGERRNLAARGRRFVEEWHSVDVVVDEWRGMID